ncbi:MAG TPA: SRPBCC family protein [Patescibacteria group bacterium]|nr:SRPBCC family protein [Patescibacteria group bacterium]
MTVIYLETQIHAPIGICFDLSLSIELHMLSTETTGERAIAGRTSGLIGLHETVTWRAKHFGIWQKLTVKITSLERPYSFTDEMLKGAFKSMKHTHTFTEKLYGTLMNDEFAFESPLGVLGKFADWLILEKYMTRLLKERNRVLKDVAESGKWQKILK